VAGEDEVTGSILITGANGFIGSRLLQVLAERGVSVIGCGRQSSKTIGVVIGNIDADTDWQAALAQVVSVVHLAGHAHVMRGDASETLNEYRRVNTEATLNLARQATASRVSRFVYISSIAVNGVQNQRPINEQDLPNPIGPYAVSKWEAEQGLREISQATGMEVVIIRPPLVYGPKSSGNFARLIRLVRGGLPLPLGGLHKGRSLVALDNLVDFIGLCIDHPAAANQTFLVCDGENLSTAELLRRIGAALNKPVTLLPLPGWLLIALAALVGKQGEARKLVASLQVDSGKAHELLGWVPPVSMDEGLRRALADITHES
jgi:nucleoside-diphosphate-sugar epimerase